MISKTKGKYFQLFLDYKVLFNRKTIFIVHLSIKTKKERVFLLENHQHLLHCLHKNPRMVDLFALQSYLLVPFLQVPFEQENYFHLREELYMSRKRRKKNKIKKPNVKTSFSTQL